MAEELKIDNAFIQPYWDGKKKHKNYNKALDVYYHLSFHFDGYFKKPWTAYQNDRVDIPANPYFSRLIDQLRPSESDVIKNYRRDNYLPVTKVPCSKVVSSLKKITKSSEFKIDYSGADNPSFLGEEKSLQNYCDTLLPKDESVEGWAYKQGVRWMLVDPNAIWVVMPVTWDIEESELMSPYPHIINCKDVLDYKEGEYVIFISPYTSTFEDKNGKEKQGKILMIITKDTFYEAQEVADKKFELIEHKHNIGEIPAGYFGGEEKTPDIYQPFYESFVGGMLPALDEVAMDSSDLRAEKIRHLFSTMWYLQGSVCDACQGSGNVNKDGSQVVCQTCNGRGSIANSPYRDMQINMNSLDAIGKNVPFPPAGYITKPTEMVGLMREEIRVGTNNAYAAINMEFLAERPNKDESGVSKGYDTDETNNFVYGIAKHLIEKIMRPIFFYINEERYMLAVPDPGNRKKMLPVLQVPQNFDFLTNTEAEDNLLKISEANVSAGIKDAAEMNYINQEYAENPEIRNKLVLVHQHDPLPGFEAETIDLLEKSGKVTKIDAILSVYISSFVTEIITKDLKFVDKSFEEQKKVLYGMAQEKLDQLDKQAQDSIEKAASNLNMNKRFDAEGNQIDEKGQIVVPFDPKKQPKPDPQKKKDKTGLNGA